MLITPAYLAEQKRLHTTDASYAMGAGRWAYLVAGIAVVEGCWSILDYGCGKGTLKQALSDKTLPTIREYDPAVPGKDKSPVTTDLVVCLDVLEHIEPECLEDVLADLRRVTRKFLFVVISTKFTKLRWLSDGRNSHLIVNDGVWWLEKLSAHKFELLRTWNTGVKEWVALLGV